MEELLLGVCTESEILLPKKDGGGCLSLWSGSGRLK